MLHLRVVDGSDGDVNAFAERCVLPDGPDDRCDVHSGASTHPRVAGPAEGVAETVHKASRIIYGQDRDRLVDPSPPERTPVF